MSGPAKGGGQRRRGSHYRVEIRVEVPNEEGTFVAVSQASQGAMSKAQAEDLYRHLVAGFRTWAPKQDDKPAGG